MPAAPAVDAEPIPGYRLLEPLGRGCFGEVWKCEAPGGMLKAIKFVNGKQGREGSRNNAQQELRALEKVKRLRHPFLLSIERVEVVDGTLMVVSELADRSLHDLLLAYRKQGKAGLPRQEALAYLSEAAEVLDFLNCDHGLQHLDVKPGNLFLIGKHVKVADFGLVASLAELDATKDQLGGITPLYAAPELFEGQPSPASDQYSLAATYTELICGEPPLRGKNITHLMLLLQTAQRNLEGLPPADRPVVHKALNRDPNLRYACCLDFVEALAAIEPPPGSGGYRRRPRSGSHAVLPSGATAVTATISGSGSFAAAGSSAHPRLLSSSGSCRRDGRSQTAVKTAVAGDQIVAGFSFQECISRGPTGELWRAMGPRRGAKLVRLITPPPLNGNGEDPLTILGNLRNPQLPAWEIRDAGPGRIALICDAGESSLATRFKEYQTAGHQGVSRKELLAFLGAIAQGLDELYQEAGLQHLGLTPKHLIFQDDEAMMLEFGLAELLWLPADIAPATVSPRYCAAELHQELISDACDQYSLALIFAELLVGVHPFHNLNARQLASPHLRAQPDLSLLSTDDRKVIARALEPDPEKRFRSCVEFLLALEESQQGDRTTVAFSSAQSPTRSTGRPVTAQGVRHTPTTQVTPGWRGMLDEMIGQVSQGYTIQTVGVLHFRRLPGSRIDCRGGTRLSPGQTRLKLAAFGERWGAELTTQSDTHLRMLIKHRAGLLQRCLGQSVLLAVDVVLGTPQAATGQLTPLCITIEPTDTASGKSATVFEELGPTLLTSLHSFVNLQNRREDQEQYPASCPARWEATPPAAAVRGQLRQIGRGGATVWASQAAPLATGIVALERPNSTPALRLPGTVEDCVSDGAGGYLIEVAFPR